MITFRYHLVSIIAVFLALAVGIIAGSTVVDQQLIKGLQQQRDADQRIKESLREDAEVLRAEVSLWQDYGDNLLLPSLRGQLKDVAVTLIVPPFTPDDSRVSIRDGLKSAGALIAGELRLGARFLLPDETAAEQLALALDAIDSRGDELLQRAGRLIGSQIGPSGINRWSSSELSKIGFLETDEQAEGTRRRHVTLLMWDATIENSPLAGTLMRSLIAASSESKQPLVVAEMLSQDPSLVTIVRDTDTLRTSIPTVDHAGTTLGAVALSAAIASLPKQTHHYGVRAGAEGPLPSAAKETPKSSAGGQQPAKGQQAPDKAGTTS